MGWKKKLLVCVGGVVAVALAGAGGFVGCHVSAYNSSMEKVYSEVQAPQLQASTDAKVIARGKHLAESIGGCIECHGEGLRGKQIEDMGPVGIIRGPNLTKGKGGSGNKYTDAQLARVIRHGIKADGTSVIFMPAPDFYWWPDSDLVAVISWLRTQPPVDNEVSLSEIGTLGKVLDRLGKIHIDIARRIDHHAPRPEVPDPAPTKEYGAYLGKLCKGCHGETLSGGPIPGAPSDLAVPTNLTPHETGLKSWTEADLNKAFNEGVRPNGEKLDPFMPIATLKTMNEIEKKALWAYLSSLEPKPFGGR